MKLLDDLADDHLIIADMLQSVVELGIITEEARTSLRAVKALMLFHLKKENDSFYPILRRAARTDKELEKLLKVSGRELEAIYAMALRFFDKYAVGGGDREFARDLGMLYAALRERILREERTLFKEYENQVSDSRPGWKSAGS